VGGGLKNQKDSEPTCRYWLEDLPEPVEAADDAFAWKTQEPAGADTGLLVMTIVVGNQNGCGRVEYNRSRMKGKIT
jgi:hypothetical protein